MNQLMSVVWEPFGEHMISNHNKFKTLVKVVVQEVLGSIKKKHDKLALNPNFKWDECGYRATYQNKTNKHYNIN